MPARKLFWLLGLGIVCLLAGLARPAFAVDPAHRKLAPPDAIVHLEIDQPLRILDHPVSQNVWAEVQKSELVKLLLGSEDLAPFMQVLQGLETSLETDWKTGLSRLTAGGFTYTVLPKNREKLLQESDQLTILSADSPETMQQFVDFLLKLYAADRIRNPNSPEIGVEDHNGQKLYGIQEAWFAAVGPRVVLSNNRKLVESLIDRMLEPEIANLSPTSGFSPENPLLRLEVDLLALRSDPDVKNYLEEEYPDQPALVAFFGGYLDLFRHGEQLLAEVRLSEQTIDVNITVDTGSKDMTPGLKGYFAARNNTAAAPLLKLPGTIYSGSSYRDYGSLWLARKQLLSEQAVEDLEEGDELLKEQLSQIGLRVKPSDLINQLGPHQRFVLARQDHIPYKVTVKNRLPAGALVVDLNDQEKFEEMFSPFLRTLAAISSAQGQIMNKSVDYKDAKIQVLWFKDDPESVKKGDEIQYNFSPSFCITRSHFIAGSTQEIVQQVIDELDRQKTENVTVEPGVTELDYLSIDEAGTAVGEFQEQLVLQMVLNSPFNIEEAESEFQLLRQALKAAGEINVSGVIQPEKTEFQLRLGTPR